MRNRIICPKVAVNEQFLPGKSNFLICLEKSKFFKNLPGKIEIFLTRIHDPPPIFQTTLTPLYVRTYVCMYVNVKSNQTKYSFIDKKDNPPDTNASGFYRRVGGGKNTNNQRKMLI